MSATKDSPGQLGEALALVKAYAKQETVGPLRGAGRWIGRGLVGIVLLANGAFFLILGVLRLLQNGTNGTFDGHWVRLIPYAVALVLALVVIVVAAVRIAKPTLQKEPRP